METLILQLLNWFWFCIVKLSDLSWTVAAKPEISSSSSSKHSSSLGKVPGTCITHNATGPWPVWMEIWLCYDRLKQRSGEDYRGPVSSLIPFHFQTFGLQPRPPLQYIYQMLYNSLWSHRRVYIIYISKYTKKKKKKTCRHPIQYIENRLQQRFPRCYIGGGCCYFPCRQRFWKYHRREENDHWSSQPMASSHQQCTSVESDCRIKYKSEGTTSACLIHQHCSYTIEIQKNKPPFFCHLMLNLIIEWRRKITF